MSDYTVSASVVLYNGFEEAAGCIDSVIEKTKGVPLQLYLIDNASPDGTGEKLQQHFSGRAEVLFPRLLLIPQDGGQADAIGAVGVKGGDFKG